MSQNPFESPAAPTEGQTGAVSQSANRPLFTWQGIVLISLVLLFAMALLAPMHRSAPTAGRRIQCINNLKNISLAVMAYHDDFGSFPPAYTQDANGRRLHSWRTLLLPYLEQEPLYHSIDLTKPWDDPANAKARSQTVNGYHCPDSDTEAGSTTYLAIVDESGVFRGANPRKLGELTDGSSDTVLFIDAPDEFAQHWMEPNDISLDQLIKAKAEDSTVYFHHHGYAPTPFCDGSVRYISDDIPDEQLKAMVTIAGGEKIEWPNP